MSESDNFDELNSMLDDVQYRGSSLADWVDELTVTLPPIPASSIQVQKAITDLNNKYQVAYNCYTEVQVMYSKARNIFENARDAAISIKRQSLIDLGVKVPPKDILENIAIDASIDARRKREQLAAMELIQNFFENMKVKLEKCMQLVLGMNYAVNASDKMNHKAGDQR